MERITWEEYFMSLALLSAKRSADPSTQVGACIVSPENKAVSIGYNGMPRGCRDEDLSWEKGEGLNSKYLYVCHAELNAILNANTKLTGCSVYVTLFPCNECAKAIIQSGIKEVIYLEDSKKTDSNFASKKLLTLAGVSFRPYTGRYSKLTLN